MVLPHQTLAPGWVPLFTSDGLDLYFHALTAHRGSWLTDPWTGKSAWQVTRDLIDGQLVKPCRRRKLVRVDRRMRLGSLEPLQTTLRKLGLTGTLQTAFIERLRLRRYFAPEYRRTRSAHLGHAAVDARTDRTIRGVAGVVSLLPPAHQFASQTGNTARPPRSPDSPRLSGAHACDGRWADRCASRPDGSGALSVPMLVARGWTPPRD